MPEPSRRRLSFYNVEAVYSIDEDCSEALSLVEEMPWRLFLAAAPLPGDEELRVEVMPRRVRAYILVSRRRGWVLALSPSRIRLRVTGPTTHIYVPGRPVERHEARILIKYYSACRGAGR